MATRNERKRRARDRFNAKVEKRLTSLAKAEIGRKRDEVMATVKGNLAKGRTIPIEERAWLGIGSSTIYSASGQISAMRYGRGNTTSVHGGSIKCGKVTGRARDWTE